MREQMQFLRSRTEKAALAGFRAALYGALFRQEKNMHMLESDLPYSSDIIEPAFASEIRTMLNLMKTVLAHRWRRIHWSNVSPRCQCIFYGVRMNAEAS